MYTVSNIISDDTLSKIIQIESSGRPNAKAPTSSASGLGQFITATWLGVLKKHRPDLLQGRSRQEILNLRFDPSIAIEMLARHTEDNANYLGAGWTEGDLYLAHFSGVGTARKLLRAPAAAPASNYFSAAAIAANRSILQGKTVGQVRRWATTKMNKAGGHNWVAVHYKGPAVAQPVPTPVPAPELEPVKIEDDIDFPDIPHIPLPIPVPPQVPQAPTPKPASRSKTIWDAIIQKVSGLFAILGTLSGEQWIVIVCVIIIILLSAHIIYERYIKPDIIKKDS